MFSVWRKGLPASSRFDSGTVNEVCTIISPSGFVPFPAESLTESSVPVLSKLTTKVLPVPSVVPKPTRVCVKSALSGSTFTVANQLLGVPVTRVKETAKLCVLPKLS